MRGFENNFQILWLISSMDEYSGSEELNFHNKVVLVIDGDEGIGRSLAIMYAERGAYVVVNADCESDHRRSTLVDLVVRQISNSGGSATANYDSIRNPKLIVKSVISQFGDLNVLVCNYGGLDRISGTDNDWLDGSEYRFFPVYKLIMECWTQFSRNKYGRIVFASSADGICGDTKNAAYYNSKLSLMGLCQTLAKEGAMDNIFTNCYVLGPTMLLTNKPQHTYPNRSEELYNLLAAFVFYLTNEACKENGGFFELGPKNYLKLESKLIRSYQFEDSISTPKQILSGWNRLLQDEGLEIKHTSEDLSLLGKVALVTGYNNDQGKLVAQQLSNMGATVIGYENPKLGRAVPKFVKGVDFTPPEVFNKFRRGSISMFKKILRFNNKVDPNQDNDLLNSASEVPGFKVIRNSSPSKAIVSVIDDYKRIDILVHCCGISDDLRLVDTAPSYFEDLFNHHIGSSFKFCQELESIKKCCIVNIAPVGAPGTDALDFALVGITKAMANLGHGIRANTICSNTKNLDLIANLACLLCCPEAPFQGAHLELNEGCLSQRELKHTMGFRIIFDGFTEDIAEAIMKKWWQISQPSQATSIKARRASTLLPKEISYSVSKLARRMSLVS